MRKQYIFYCPQVFSEILSHVLAVLILGLTLRCMSLKVHANRFGERSSCLLGMEFEQTEWSVLECARAGPCNILPPPSAHFPYHGSEMVLGSCESLEITRGLFHLIYSLC